MFQLAPGDRSQFFLLGGRITLRISRHRLSERVESGEIRPHEEGSMRSLISVLCFLLLIPKPVIPPHSKPAGIAAGDTLANHQIEPPMKAGPRQINIDQVNSETQDLRRPPGCRSQGS